MLLLRIAKNETAKIPWQIISEYFIQDSFTAKSFHNRNRRQHNRKKINLHIWNKSQSHWELSISKASSRESDSPIPIKQHLVFPLPCAAVRKRHTEPKEAAEKLLVLERVTLRMWGLTWSDQRGSGQSHSKQMSSSYKCTKRQLDDHKIRKIGFSGKRAEKATEL